MLNPEVQISVTVVSALIEDLAAKDAIGELHVLARHLQEVGHVLLVIEPERLVDPNEQVADSGPALEDFGGFREIVTCNNKCRIYAVLGMAYL